MEWWKKLPHKVTAKVVSAGFGDFLSHLPVADRDRKLPVALAERWWDSTNSFHLLFEEMTLTPLDFTCITGVAVGGLPISWDYNVRENANYIKEQLGWVPAFASGGAIRVTDILSFYKDKAIDENDDVQLAHLTRAFFLYMLGRTLLSNTAETIHLCCLPALEDVDRIGDYNWGGAGMATLYRFMSAVSRRLTKRLGGYSFVWEVWTYEILQISPYKLKQDERDVLPRMWRWRSCNRANRQSPFTVEHFHRAIDTINPENVNWLPFPAMALPSWYLKSKELTATRLLLDGPMGRFYYLGERVIRQVYMQSNLPIGHQICTALIQFRKTGYMMCFMDCPLQAYTQIPFHMLRMTSLCATG
nr:protein MAIN-LIKE 2-like [Coffea arabica]